jgi:hypothetical protein
VRPGSIGTAKGKKEGKKFPKWSDITITRGPRSGSFNVLFKFRILKGQNSDEDMREEDSLDFTINSPQSSDHLSISPAHRMLAMALRRTILDKHESLESLLDERKYYVKIKPAKADEPSFLAGRGHGMPKTASALTAKNITEYFQKAAMRSGYGTNSTPYAWRRKAATPISRAVGPDRAHHALNYAMNSTTLEKYYEQGNFDLPVMEIAKGGNVESAQR